MEIKTIAVIGAGTMGSGIAQVAAEAGYHVILFDTMEASLEKGSKVIEKNLSRHVGKGKCTKEEASKILTRIECTLEIERIAQADLLIEAIIEKMDIKKELYKQLDTICKPTTIFASNTSGLSITELSTVTNRSDKIIGMHFFNPVPVMKLVELVRGHNTSEATFDTMKVVTEKLGKEMISVNDAPLFVVNRILVPMINEAIFVLSEGTASAEDIDRGMVLGANHPIGPLALADLVGLDTLLFVQETLYEETSDSKYRPCPLLRKLVRAGHLGRKTGKGFYSYQ